MKKKTQNFKSNNQEFEQQNKITNMNKIQQI